MIPIIHRHCDDFYIIHWSYTSLQHHQIIMHDLSLLFHLSFTFIFHVICEDSSPSYACMNKEHLVLYNVQYWFGVVFSLQSTTL